MHARRLTVGFLVSYLTEDYTAELWRGLVKAAERRGVDLLAIDGGAIDDPYEIHRQKATLYSVIQNVTLDGIIVSAGSIGNFADDARMEEFLRSLPRVPQILIGKPVGNRPCVLVDNRMGMRDVVSHLIEEHGRRRVAFIAGSSTNREAMDRLTGYREALEEHGVPYNPALVYHGDFDRTHGARAVQTFFTERALQPDAIVASTDYNAISAIEELGRRGIAVPQAVAVTGFDGIRNCVCTSPTVTTVSQPYDAIGEAALDLARESIQGAAARTVTLPTRTILRSSCGCTIPQAGAGTRAQDQALASRLRHAALQCTSTGSKQPLLDVLDAALKEETGLFPSFSHCHDALHGIFENERRDASEQDASSRVMASELYMFALEYLGKKVEDLQKANAVRIRHMYVTLNQFHERSSFTFDRTAFPANLDETLPRIGVTSFLMCLYHETTARVRVEHLFSVDTAPGLAPGAVDGPERIIDAFLGSHDKENMPGSLILLPLFYRDEDLGFILCRVSVPDGALYESLISQISNTIKGAELVSAVRSYSEELERKVEQRSAELKKALADLERVNRRLEALSLSDELTSLCNRRGFLANSRQHFDLARSRGREFLLFYVDIDGLKAINDSFGHLNGDDALRNMSSLLKKAFRQTDIIGRLGGDEFAVLAMDMKPDQEHLVRQRLSAVLDDFNKTAGKPYVLAYSMGCAAWQPSLYESLEDMIDEADRRLYAEKRKMKTAG
jgi:diguanylate cyclase (GGDEF)-like protein